MRSIGTGAFKGTVRTMYCTVFVRKSDHALPRCHCRKDTLNDHHTEEEQLHASDYFDDEHGVSSGDTRIVGGYKVERRPWAVRY